MCHARFGRHKDEKLLALLSSPDVATPADRGSEKLCHFVLILGGVTFF